MAMFDLRSWCKEPAAKVVGPASARAWKAVTERAIAKSPGRDDFELSE
ncbi:hypothetical protein ACFY64_02895 [Streptomyces collinus]